MKLAEGRIREVGKIGYGNLRFDVVKRRYSNSISPWSNGIFFNNVI